MTVVKYDAVLLAIADPSRRERYAGWLDESFGVRCTAAEDDIDEKLDEEIAVVVVDVAFPSRGQLLDRISEMSRPCQTILLSAEARDLDRIEQPYDTVLATPTAADPFRTAVTQAFARGEHERLVQEYFTLADQLVELDVETNGASAEYTIVMDRIEEIHTQLDSICEKIDNEFTVLFGDFTPTTNRGARG